MSLSPRSFSPPQDGPRDARPGSYDGTRPANTAHAAHVVCQRRLLAIAQEFETIRINAGGDDYLDSTGNHWREDPSSLTASAPGVQIAGTVDPALFRTLRYSTSPELAYVLPVPSGIYRVRVMFAELWGGAFAPGVRRFQVAAEGRTFFPDVDVFAEVGGYAALEKTFNVTVTDGTLNLAFVQRVQNPIVSAVEVTATTGPGTPSDLTVQGATASLIELTWPAVSDDVAVVGYEVERCEGSTCTDFAYAGTTPEAVFSDTDRAPSTRIPVPRSQRRHRRQLQPLSGDRRCDDAR